MALFQIDNSLLKLVRPENFNYEREIQSLIERNLETVFDCRLVASEFPTGTAHAGRIDTLALSEDGNPVIIEYKKIESSELVNQSLYYLSWIQDHRGDFQVAANRALGGDVEVDWTDIRVICIAPGYKKYDLHAVQMMGANIELWQYRLFQNKTLYLEEVFRRASGLSADIGGGQQSPALSAGKKAAITRATGSYTFEEHLEKAAASQVEMLQDLREYILGLDDSVEESPKKLYVAYKVTQNFVCIVVQKKTLILFLKLNPAEMTLPLNARDVQNIGHHGTGDLELTVESLSMLAQAKELIRLAYERAGGS